MRLDFGNCYTPVHRALLLDQGNVAGRRLSSQAAADDVTMEAYYDGPQSIATARRSRYSYITHVFIDLDHLSYIVILNFNPPKAI